jgi:DNA (cytosine-5)-methyltransferase 1
MFPEAVRAVREIQPEAFLFENVKGLARPNFAPYLDYIVHQLRHPWLTRKIDEDWADHFKRLQHIDKSGLTGDGPEYTVECSKISCADYGAPQLRQRVVFIGFRKDLDIEWTLPKATHSEAALLYDQYVSGEYWKRHGKSPQRVPIQHRAEVERMKILGQLDNKKPWATVRDSIHAFGAPARIKDRVSIEHDQHVLIPGARVYEGHSGSPLDWPGKTLKAGVHGVPGGENTVVLDNGEIRYFTVREAASLQGFPPDYSFAGIWGECMRQIGNAVPVMVAEFFASEIRKKLTASKRLALAAG